MIGQGPGTAGEAEAPLAGVHILITRPAGSADDLETALRHMGAEVHWLPTIAIDAPADGAPLLAAAAAVDSYGWVVFTSANAVSRFYAARREVVGSGSIPAHVRICAVGPATANAVERVGDRVEVLPAEFVGESLVAGLVANGLRPGDRVLFPRAERTRAIVATSLRQRGAEVVEVVAYRTVADDRSADELQRLLTRGELDVVTFTSSSAVRSFVRMVGSELGRAKVAVIGPITAEAARDAGLVVDIEGGPYTAGGLAAAIKRYYSSAADA